jgi:hypothetical protein
MARANHRSPNYPRLAFDAALEKARIVYDRHHKHSVSREAMAQALGYTSFNNGASKAVIAALKYYGLLEPAGDGLCISSDAVRALELPQQDPERAAALVRMVFAPPIFADLRSRTSYLRTYGILWSPKISHRMPQTKSFVFTART